MFSGIVETIGIIIDLQRVDGCKNFTILPQQIFDDIAIGDSIAINGVCLTVTELTNESFNVTVVPETLRLTNLNHLVIGDKVNAERSLKVNSRLSGHLVQGHVDAMGEILEIENDHSSALLVKISLPKKLSHYVISKGYIGLDGMSITVINATPTWFSVTFIPHTQAVTIINQYHKGSLINIEVDMVGKYIEKILGAYTHAT